MKEFFESQAPTELPMSNIILKLQLIEKNAPKFLSFQKQIPQTKKSDGIGRDI